MYGLFLMLLHSAVYLPTSLNIIVCICFILRKQSDFVVMMFNSAVISGTVGFHHDHHLKQMVIVVLIFSQ